MVEVDSHEDAFQARVIDSALEREIINYLSTRTYKGFERPFGGMHKYIGDVNSKLVTIFPFGVEVESIDLVDCEYEMELAAVGRKYGLELLLPEWAYNEE